MRTGTLPRLQNMEVRPPVQIGNRRQTSTASPLTSAKDFLPRNPTWTWKKKTSEAQSSELKVKVFKEPDWEWARFVMSNRDINTTQPCHDYDIVIGPVADDTIARLLRLYTENFINEEQLLHELTFSKVTSQYFFHSEAAIKMLKRL